MLSRVAAATVLSVLVGCGGPQVDHQTPAMDVRATPPLVPISPLLFDYTVWDHHFLQWLSAASPYEMVELFVKDRPEGPRLWVLLTERAAMVGSKRQVHLVNHPALQQRLEQSRGDREVLLRHMSYQREESATACRLKLQVATPLGHLDWEFVSAGLPSAEHGQRLIDVTEAAHDLRGGLLVFYLEQSALAAQETRFRLGDHDEPASAWSELSRPPHFMAFRGVYSRPAHVGYFPSLEPTTISLVSDPESAQATRTWKYLFTTGRAEAQELQVKASVEGVRWDFVSERFIQKARKLNDEFLTSELTATDGARNLTLRFNPPAPDLMRMQAGRHQTTWELSMNGGERLLFGDLLTSKTSRGIQLRFEPRAPDWARRLPLRVRITPTQSGYVYESQTELAPQ